MKILRSFKYAFNGIKIVVTEETNAIVHLAIAGVVLIVSFVFRINIFEWIAVIIVIGFVIVSEIINTAIENLADFVENKNNPIIKRVKDISAAAVLVSAITASITGLLIFLPKIIDLF